MDWLLIALVGAALICPLMMLGPMLLRRLGITKGPATGGMSCMGMMHGHQAEREHPTPTLVERRRALDREIAEAEEELSRARDSEREAATREG